MNGEFLKCRCLYPFLMVFLLSCESDLEKVQKISLLNEKRVETGKDVELNYSENGKTKAKLLTPLMKTHEGENPYIEMPEGLKLYFYNDHLEISSKLSSNYGIRFLNKGITKVTGNVVIVNTKGEKLATEELIWEENKEKIYSDKFVRITTPDEVIYGTGFESDQNFSSYRIKDIKGTVKINLDPDE